MITIRLSLKVTPISSVTYERSLLRNLHTMTNYYVATEDGMHFDMFEHDLSIFEALCVYYQSIIDGSLGWIQELELGYTTDSDDIEPILTYEFN